MTCADFEILLADYLDQNLPAARRADFEAHLASCPSCRAYADDVSGAVAFIGRAASPEPPPELVTKLLFEITNGPSRSVIKPSLGRRLFGRWLEPVFQPRFAMGMAMTVLSISLMFRFSGVRDVKPGDLDPVAVYHSVEDRATRAWDRAVKYYHSLEIVFAIQSRYEEWTQRQAAQDAASKGETPNGKDAAKQ
jgi:hypothetical protein